MTETHQQFFVFWSQLAGSKTPDLPCEQDSYSTVKEFMDKISATIKSVILERINVSQSTILRAVRLSAHLRRDERVQQTFLLQCCLLTCSFLLILRHLHVCLEEALLRELTVH